jgi:ribosome-associated translation inhibitor RaiA
MSRIPPHLRTSIEESIKEFVEFYKSLGKRCFTTEDAVDFFKDKKTSIWRELTSIYGEGGKGCGKYYTPHTYIAQTIDRLIEKGELDAKIGFHKNDIHSKCNDSNIQKTFAKASDKWGHPCVKHWIILE